MKTISQGHGNQKCITLWFTEDMAARMDRLAEKGDIPRSRLLKNLIEIGIDYLERADKVGLVSTAVLLRDFGAWCRSVLRCSEEPRNGYKVES